MKYKKCKHDKCMRKATLNGYCNSCIQLNTKKCNMCSSVKKIITLSGSKGSEKEKKSKHNFWINGLESGSNFFHYIYKLGSGIFFVIVFITCFYFWSNYYLTNLDNPVINQASLFFIWLFRLCMYLIVGGLIFKYFCLFLSQYLNKKEEDAILKEGVKKFIKNE